ncbi:MAG TPA: hypothetical protein VF136_12875 [Methylomirabilota bacterium]
MATNMRDRPTPIVVGSSDPGRPVRSAASFRRAASWALWGTAIVFLVGSVLDLVILWLFQRQPNPQWEFTAVAISAEGLPRILLGVALAYGALQLRDSASLLAYRLLAVGLIAVGVIGAVLGGLMLSDYFILRSSVNPEAVGVFRSGVFKTLALCAMYVFVLLPVGVAAWRRPRGS